MSDPCDVPVHRIRVPNPFVEGRTCVYVIAADPVTLVDTGVATDRAWEELLAGLREHGLRAGDIRRVVLTHKHIDHIGNAWRFHRESGAEILIHECERESVADADPTGRRFASAVNSRLTEWNVPDRIVSADVAHFGSDWKLESAPVTTLVDGQRLPLGDGQLEVVHTPGHTLGSVCLKFGRYLFSGDHLLPDISPNVGGGDLRTRGLLRHYLASLGRIRDLAHAGDLLVMPGHGDPLSTVAERCEELIRHHQERVEQIVAILTRRSELTIYEIACELFGRMNGFHVVLGCAEAHAHLEFLEEQGDVAHREGRYDVRGARA